MSRKAITDDKFRIVDSLKQIQEGEGSKISRFLKDKLVAAGYLDMIEYRNPGQRGKTSKKFEISGKGRGYLGMSKSWKRP